MIKPPVTSEQTESFRSGSKTYFNASRFFPPAVRSDVVRLYAFVRTADNLVDDIPQDAAGFQAFRSAYRQAMQGMATGNHIIDDFAALSAEKQFDPAWAEAFLNSMAADLTKQRYETIDETLQYIYGSAEVIGYYMSVIMGLPKQAMEAAALQGRAMQMINFIRDIAEDNSLGRTYLPMSETSLANLQLSTVQLAPQEFERFVRAQLVRYETWQTAAYAGYAYIPRQYRIPVQTASDMYNWTARGIARNPLVVYHRKLKPSKLQVVWAGLLTMLFLPKRA